MLRQRSFSRRKKTEDVPPLSVAHSLHSLLDTVLVSLGLLKDQTEAVDDELFSLRKDFFFLFRFRALSLFDSHFLLPSIFSAKSDDNLSDL